MVPGDAELRDLRRTPLFSELEAEAQHLVAYAAEIRILRAGDVLFRRGEQSDCGYLVRIGSVGLDSGDNGSPVHRIIGPDGLIGQTALLTDTERPATAVAREPTTLLKVSRVLFHRVLREFPKSALRLRGKLNTSLGSLMAELKSMGADTLD